VAALVRAFLALPWTVRWNAVFVVTYVLLMSMTRSLDPARHLWNNYQTSRRDHAFDKRSAAYQGRVERLKTRAAVDGALRGWGRRRLDGYCLFRRCVFSHVDQEQEKARRRLHRFAGSYTIVYSLRDEARVGVFFDKDGRRVSEAEYWEDR